MLSGAIRTGLGRRFIRNPVPGEDLHHVFCRSHNGRYIETNVNSARTKSLFLDVVARKPNGKDGTNDRNGLKEFLYNRPANSAFDRLRHSLSQKPNQLGEIRL